MKYSLSETLILANSLNGTSCLVFLNDLIRQEGYTGSIIFDQSVQVIDMDCHEANIAAIEVRPLVKSMDCTFAILDSSRKQLRLLLVEFRFNYVNLRNLRKASIDGKVNGSKGLLQNSVILVDTCVFVFTTSLKAQARSRLFRMNPRVPSNYITMDIPQLKAAYF